MPLVKRCIEPVFLSRGEVPPKIADELQFVTNSTLANVIRQLSSLSEHADDLFGDILRDTELFTSRTNQLATRVQKLKRNVTQLDSTVEEVLLQEVNSKKHFKSTVRKDAQLFTIDSRPKSICDQYAKCDSPPELRKLNEFRDDNFDCMKYYTNPNYFFELWSQEAMLAVQQNEEKINKRRKHKRPKNRAPHHIKAAKSKRDEMQRYKHGKELTVQRPSQTPPTPAAAPSSVAPPLSNQPRPASVAQHQQHQQQQQQQHPPPLPPTEQIPQHQQYATHVVHQPAQQPPPPPPPCPNVYEVQSINLDQLPPPPPPIDHSNVTSGPTNAVLQDGLPKQPTTCLPSQQLPPTSQHVSRAPSMIHSARPNCAPPPAPLPKQQQHPQTMQANTPSPTKPVPQTASAATASSAPPPPPLPPSFDDFTAKSSSAPKTQTGPSALAPPAPPPVPLSSQVERMQPNSLLSQIANVKLNAPDTASIASSESSTTKVDSRSDLLVAIVNGIKLRKVEERKEKSRDQKQKSKVLDVQQIMENAFEMRRKALEVDQDDSDDGEHDDDDDDWSDDD